MDMSVRTTPTESLIPPRGLTRFADTPHDPRSPSPAVRSFTQSRGIVSRRAGPLSTGETFGRESVAAEPLRWRPDTPAPITRPPRGLPARGGGTGGVAGGRSRQDVHRTAATLATLWLPSVSDLRRTCDSTTESLVSRQPRSPRWRGTLDLGDRTFAGSIPAGAIAADVVYFDQQPILSRSGSGFNARRRRGRVATSRGDPHRGRQRPMGAGPGRVCNRHGPVGIPGATRSSPRDEDAPACRVRSWRIDSQAAAG